MVTCPVCEGAIDIDQEDVDEGDTIKVVGTDPLEVESSDEEEEDEEDSYLEEDEEDEEEADEDWK